MNSSEPAGAYQKEGVPNLAVAVCAGRSWPATQPGAVGPSVQALSARTISPWTTTTLSSWVSSATNQTRTG